MAIAETHIRIGNGYALTAAGDGIGLDQDVLGFRAVTAGVHGQGATDCARHAAIEFQPGNAVLRRHLGDIGIQRRRPGFDAGLTTRRHIGEAASQPDHHAVNAAVAHQEVRADTDGQDRDARIEVFEEFAEISGIFRQEDDIGRSADTKPGEGRQIGAGHHLAAHRRQVGDPGVRVVGHALHQNVTVAASGSSPSASE